MQNRFEHIMVDEFQDTNALQFELVRVLGDAYRNICVVGDPDQSIYSWRNARPENMDRLAEVLPGCKLFELSESYRSTKTIIAAASGFDLSQHMTLHRARVVYEQRARRTDRDRRYGTSGTRGVGDFRRDRKACEV